MQKTLSNKHLLPNICRPPRIKTFSFEPYMQFFLESYRCLDKWAFPGYLYYLHINQTSLKLLCLWLWIISWYHVCLAHILGIYVLSHYSYQLYGNLMTECKILIPTKDVLNQGYLGKIWTIIACKKKKVFDMIEITIVLTKISIISSYSLN